MDDDDQYPPQSFQRRIEALRYSRAVACSTLGSFHIRRMISHISHPPPDMSLDKRISEASLGFHKSLWEERQFLDNVVESEGEGFFKNRTDEISLLPFLDIIHSLLHEGNENVRRGIHIKDQEPNGNHFEWSDDLFRFITQLPRLGETPQTPSLPTSLPFQQGAVPVEGKQEGHPDMS